MQRKRLARVIKAMLLVAASYGLALLQHDVLRPDACLDSGGAWDRQADACVHDAAIGVVPQAYPRWVFLSFGTLSVGILLVACAGVGATFRRRWASARSLGRLSALTATGVFLGTMALAMLAATAQQPPPFAKSMRLGQTISEFMNATATIYLGGMIGVLIWLVGAWGERRARRATA